MYNGATLTPPGAPGSPLPLPPSLRHQVLSERRSSPSLTPLSRPPPSGEESRTSVSCHRPQVLAATGGAAEGLLSVRRHQAAALMSGQEARGRILPAVTRRRKIGDGGRAAMGGVFDEKWNVLGGAKRVRRGRPQIGGDVYY